jgi:hypothetical protein
VPRAGRHAEVAADTPAALIPCRHVRQRDHVCRARPGRAELERAGGIVQLEQVAQPGRLDNRRPRPGVPRPRQVAELDRHPLAERQHVQPVRSGPQRMPLGDRQVDDHIARPHLADGVVLPQQAPAVQHEEDLLLGAVHVSRSRAAAGLDPDPVQAHPVAAGGGAQVVPVRIDVARSALVSLDLVPVDNVVAHRSPSQ